MDNIRIYLAGPLFTVAEREFNRKLGSYLKKEFPSIIIDLPQEYSASIYGQPNSLDLVFENCLQSIKKSDLIIAVLDGPDVDSGTCIEIGYAYAYKKPILGIRTDFRESEYKGVNLMVSKSCNDIIRSKNITCDFKDISYQLGSAIRDLLLTISSRS